VTPLVPALLAAAACAVMVAPARVGRARLVVGRATPRLPGSRPVWLSAAAVGGLLLGPVAAVLSGVGAVLLRRVLARRRLAVGERAERARALEALAVLAGDLRAGRVPADALAAAASVAAGGAARAFASAASAARLGGDVPAALTAHPSAVPEVLRGLAACWAVCVTTGSGLASGVERLSDALRAAEVQRRSVQAELAAPRATAGLLAVLPLAGVAMAAALGADPLHVLLHTPAGITCLLAGTALDAAGLLWTQRLVTRAGGT
jgi:tight adherence protein B